jgi:hypothetical protein
MREESILQRILHFLRVVALCSGIVFLPVPAHAQWTATFVPLGAKQSPLLLSCFTRNWNEWPVGLA